VGRSTDFDVDAGQALDLLFQSTPVGLAVYDLELRYLRVNPTLAAMNGVSCEEHVGRHVTDVLPGLPSVHDGLLKVIATGEPVSSDIVGRTAADPDDERAWVTNYHPLRDAGGRVVAIGAAVIDVTDRRRAEGALRRSRDEHRFLADAGRLLASSLDLEATLESIADLAVPTMADWCAVDLVDEQGVARNVALAGTDRAALALARRLPPYADERSESTPPVVRVIASGRYELHADAGEQLLRDAARSDDEREIWRALRIRSVLIVPMVARGRTIGAISFVTARSERSFHEDDVAFAERLAAHCGIAVDNARLFGERTEAARQLQESLLPPGMPDLPGFDLAARYRPAGTRTDVGGDFYDVFPTGPDSWLLDIGDVQGKGPRAAAVTGLARYTIRAAASRGGDSATVLRTLNEALLREEGGRRFLTLVYATVDLAGPEPRIAVSNAGHPLPIVVRALGGVETVGGHGLLLGITPDLRLSDEATPHLEPGDALVLYTDGVIETVGPDGEQLGEEGLLRLLEDCGSAPAEAIADRVLGAALGESGEARDDVAVLVMRRS
jgi:PAS domain S-box-containing protein